jgi:hypothetical protein
MALVCYLSERQTQGSTRLNYQAYMKTFSFEEISQGSIVIVADKGFVCNQSLVNVDNKAFTFEQTSLI